MSRTIGVGLSSRIPSISPRCSSAPARPTWARHTTQGVVHAATPSRPCKRAVIRPRGRLLGLSVKAIDAPQEFDLEARWRRQRVQAQKLKIGIVGFGPFGRFMARRLVDRGHMVLAYNALEDFSEEAKAMKVSYFSDADDFCEERPDVVMLCTSILSTQKVVESLPLQRLRRSTLFMDVLSVKRFPKMMLLEVLPEEFDILCTHPMFGLNHGSKSWANLNFMYEVVRVRDGEERQKRVENVLKIFREEGCNMVEMSCEEHDRLSASTQFVTHTVGRMLGKMDLQSTPINTKGYEALLQLVDQTNSLSFDLYYGLFLYNENAVDDLERMEEAFEGVKKLLFGQLHNIARKQIFPESMLAAEADARRLSQEMKEGLSNVDSEDTEPPS